MTQDVGGTIEVALARAFDAYAALAELGETIEEEWSYVQDLSTTWRERLESVASARGDESVHTAVEMAIDAAIDEIARIQDPHRAIDWLSTFPQVTLLALGETP